MSKMSLQKKGTIVATLTAMFLTTVKIFVAVFSGSLVVLVSALDSLLDVAISFFNFWAIKKAEESVTRQFQYGKGKVQAIASVIEGVVVIVSSLYILYEAIIKLINKSEISMLTSSMILMIFSIFITFFLVRYLQKIANQTDNLVTKSDALHYKMDLFTNVSILIALLFIYFTKWNFLDSIFGFSIGIYMIISAVKIIKEGIFVLLDHALSNEIISKIEQIINMQSEVHSFHWLKTRTDGSKNFVEFHLVLEPEMKLRDAHDISDKIEEEIAKVDKKKIWIVTPHYDPVDDEEINNAVRSGEYIKTSDYRF